MNKSCLSKVVVDRLCEHFDIPDFDAQRISFCVSVLRINEQHFYHTMSLVIRLLGEIDGCISDVFIGCFMIVNKLGASVTPNRCLSQMLTIALADLLDMELSVLTTLTNIVVHPVEIDQLRDISKTEVIV